MTLRDLEQPQRRTVRGSLLLLPRADCFRADVECLGKHRLRKLETGAETRDGATGDSGCRAHLRHSGSQSNPGYPGYRELAALIGDRLLEPQDNLLTDALRLTAHGWDSSKAVSFRIWATSPALRVSLALFEYTTIRYTRSFDP